MRRRSTPCFVALLAATVLVSGGCGRAAPDRVATINGEPVTGKEFDAFLSAKLGEFSREPLADSVKSQLFDDFVKRRVTIQEARQRGLRVTHEAPTPTSVKEPIRAEIASDLLVAKYYREVVLRGVTVSAQEVADYYETHRADYSRPNGYYVREFRASTREEAERWRSRIASNAQTARPAEPARAGDPAERRGSLSFYETGQLPHVLERAIEPLEVGQVSPVVSSSVGFHVFRLESRSAPLPIERVRDEIVTELRTRKNDRLVREDTERLLGRAHVDVVSAHLRFQYEGRFSKQEPVASP
jgi:hypothetical protein